MTDADLTAERMSPPAIIVACEIGGGYQIGIGDDSVGPFPSRAFALAVAEQRIARLARPDCRERR